MWCGGWDDIFPTDAPCEINVNAFHDHGDLWIGPWTWSLEKDDADETMRSTTSRDSVCHCHARSTSRWISVTREGHGISVGLRLTNHGLAPVRFMWNQHIAHAIGPGSRVHVPAATMGVIAPAALLDDAHDVSWPLNSPWLGPQSTRWTPETEVLEFLHAREIREGCRWPSLTPARGVAVRIDFDKEVFRALCYGGCWGDGGATTSC